MATTLEKLQNKFKTLVESDGIPDEFVTIETPREFVLEDIVDELAYTVQGYLDWYFDKTDSRQDRIHGKEVKGKEELKKLVGEVVEEELRDAKLAKEELPETPFVERIVNDLVGLVVSWKDWYLDWKVAVDRDDWLEGRGLTEEIYLEDRYGDVDKTDGVAYGIYTEESRPYPRRDQQGYII